MQMRENEKSNDNNKRKSRRRLLMSTGEYWKAESKTGIEKETKESVQEKKKEGNGKREKRFDD